LTNPKLEESILLVAKQQLCNLLLSEKRKEFYEKAEVVYIESLSSRK